MQNCSCFYRGGAFLQYGNVKQGNISHLSESEGCEFVLVFIFWTSDMQAVEAGMVAVAASMVVKTAGVNMCNMIPVDPCMGESHATLKYAFPCDVPMRRSHATGAVG